MGFLDHSTNNIIVDAVLTDVGRKLLANNDGSFSIVKFALGDDEVDYTTIQKYGRTVGKERIEKNTPVYEAQTNSNIALKYKLISVSNSLLVRLPSLSLSSPDATGDTVSLNTGTTSATTINIQQTITSGESIPDGLKDDNFIVSMPDRFLQITGDQADFVDVNSVAQYIVTANGADTPQGGRSLTFGLSVKSISSTQFTVYGDATNKNQITRVLSIVGVSSGAEKQFKVVITKS